MHCHPLHPCVILIINIIPEEDRQAAGQDAARPTQQIIQTGAGSAVQGSGNVVSGAGGLAISGDAKGDVIFGPRKPEDDL